MKREKIEKTNVMRLLDRAHIAYTPHFYDHQDGVIDGAGVAKKLNQDPRCVFKTLVTRGKSGNYHVFCIPVEKELDLKKCAVAAKEKAVGRGHHHVHLLGNKFGPNTAPGNTKGVEQNHAVPHKSNIG